MEFRWKHPHSGHNAGITRRGEGSENTSRDGKWCLFSDPSPLRAQLTKSTIMEIFFWWCGLFAFVVPFRNPDGDYVFIVWWEYKKNPLLSMEFRRYDPHSGHNAGITRRGEGSENASLGGKWCLFSDPSPVRAQSTKSTTMEMFLWWSGLFTFIVFSKSGWWLRNYWMMRW